MVSNIKLRGFSLIEVSISLLILGIISSVSISQFASVKRIQAEINTRSNIDYILKALGAYYISTDGLLPAPASQNFPITGKQIPGNENFGIVPYKSLGIMEKYAKDGYGNWLLYKLNPDIGKKYRVKDKNLGINEFDSDDDNDKVILVIKYYTNKKEHIIWYSENNFAKIFANGRIDNNNNNDKFAPQLLEPKEKIYNDCNQQFIIENDV